jgi:hypothetical protein
MKKAIREDTIELEKLEAPLTNKKLVPSSLRIYAQAEDATRSEKRPP